MEESMCKCAVHFVLFGSDLIILKADVYIRGMRRVRIIRSVA